MTSPRPAPPRRLRGYALAIVLLVSVLFSIALTSMFFALGSATKLTAQNLAVRRSQYLCDGVVDLANQEIRRMLRPPPRTSGGFAAPPRQMSIEELNAGLNPLRAGVRRDGVTINALQVDMSGSEGRLSVVPSGALAGTEIRVAELNLVVNLSSGDGPPCNARQVHPLATVSLFQFPALSVSTLDANEPGSSDWRFPNSFTYAWGRNGASVAARDIDAPQPRSASAAALTLPSAPDSSTSTNGLHFLVEAPQPGDRAPARLALDADLRILDGEWYVNDGSYPGRRIYSDHPCTDTTAAIGCSNVTSSGNSRAFADDTLPLRRQYSRYERNRNGFLDGTLATLGAGVVSYGGVVGGVGGEAHDPAGFLSAAVCPVAGGGAYTHAGECRGSAAAGGRRSALVDAARSGFVDDGTPRLPINIDLATLASAFSTRTEGELGTELCLPASRIDTGGCRRVFNGLVYISARRGTPLTTSPLDVDVVPGDARAGEKVPWPLCGEIATSQNSLDAGEGAAGVFTETHINGCDDADYARVNAVRLLRGRDLSAFAVTGLTIATDLPLYVVGDLNVVGRNARVALIADRITAVSVAYSDRERPIAGSGVAALPFSGSRNVSWQTSILAGTPRESAEPTSPPRANIVDLVRTFESTNFGIDLEGALAIGWANERPGGARAPNRFHWTYPRDLLSALDTAHPPKPPRATFLLPGARR
jgi:hypothetical protein